MCALAPSIFVLETHTREGLGKPIIGNNAWEEAAHSDILDQYVSKPRNHLPIIILLANEKIVTRAIMHAGMEMDKRGPLL